MRLFYQSAPNVDIAPVSNWSGGGFALPNGKGGWLRTNPDFHASYVARRDKELNYKLKPLVLMLKRWNNVHSKHLKSFHLEVIASTVFSSLGNDSRDSCEKFFAWAQNSLAVQDPAGHSGDLSIYLNPSSRQSVIQNLEAARVRAAAANLAARNGNHRESIRLWRIVFGDEFPAYG